MQGTNSSATKMIIPELLQIIQISLHIDLEVYQRYIFNANIKKCRGYMLSFICFYYSTHFTFINWTFIRENKKQTLPPSPVIGGALSSHDLIKTSVRRNPMAPSHVSLPYLIPSYQVHVSFSVICFKQKRCRDCLFFF